jgi:hypothetical protein
MAGTAVMGTGANAGRVASITPNPANLVSYETAPTIILSAPSAGTTATATAILDASGRISSFTVTNPGAGYGNTTPSVNASAAIGGSVPLKVRGALDPVTAQFSYSSLGANESYSVTLAPGASTELVIVVDRAAMTGAVGTLRANLLRITDSLNQTQQDLAVSAVIGTQHGLWSGMAIIDDVTQIEGSTVVQPVVATGKAVLGTGTNAGKVVQINLEVVGSFYTEAPTISFSGGGGTGAAATATISTSQGTLQDITITNAGSGYTAAPTVTFSAPQGKPNVTKSSFQVPFLLHVDGSGTVRLLQQAFLGTNGSTPVVATAESNFGGNRKPSSRLSVASLPAGFVRASTGVASLTSTATFEVLLDYDSDSNPLVHRFHPDHDNLDARFATKLPAGRESLTVRRTVALDFRTPVTGMTDPAWGYSLLGGTYTETIEGLRAQTVIVKGSFVINRVIEAPTLLTTP